MLKSGITRYHGVSILSFIRIFFKYLYHFMVINDWYMGIPVSLTCCLLLIMTVFNFSYSCGPVAVVSF